MNGIDISEVKRRIQIDTTQEADQEIAQEVFEVFANLHPHEAYEQWPDRFWEYFQAQRPGVSRTDMEAMLRETDDAKAGGPSL
jgi:hypothetical protein